MLSSLIQKVADNNGLSYEDTYKIISHQFLNVRQQLSKPEINSVFLPKIGTFWIHKAKLRKRLDALISYKNKKKYIHDSITNLLEKGIVPSSEDFKRDF